MGGGPGHLPHPLTPLQEERPGHHRVQEQPPGAPLRLLPPLRHQRGARGPGPPLGAGQRQAQLPDPHPQAHRVGHRQGRQAQASVRRTPLDRLLDTDALTKAQKTDPTAYRNQLNPAAITRRINELQDVLIRLAKDKTDQSYLAQLPQHPAPCPQGHPRQERLLAPNNFADTPT